MTTLSFSCFYEETTHYKDLMETDCHLVRGSWWPPPCPLSPAPGPSPSRRCPPPRTPRLSRSDWATPGWRLQWRSCDHEVMTVCSRTHLWQMRVWRPWRWWGRWRRSPRLSSCRSSWDLWRSWWTRPRPCPAWPSSGCWGCSAASRTAASAGSSSCKESKSLLSHFIIISQSYHSQDYYLYDERRIDISHFNIGLRSAIKKRFSQD